MKIAPWVYAAGILLLGMCYARACWEPSIRADERARALDRHDDSTVSRLVYEARTAETKLLRERDSTGREIRRLRARIAPRDSALVDRKGATTPDSADNSPNKDYSVRDSLIGVLVAGRAQDSLQTLFWKAQTLARDSVISSLQASRNVWRSRSERRWFCVGGPTVAVGLSGSGVIGVGVSCGWRL